MSLYWKKRRQLLSSTEEKETKFVSTKWAHTYRNFAPFSVADLGIESIQIFSVITADVNIVLDNNTLEELSHLKYLGSDGG